MKKSVRIGLIVVAVAIVLFVAGCTSLPPIGSKAPTKAVAVLRPLQGSTVQGTVTFIQEGSGVRIVADVSGLTPGKHGITIHEFGDCTAADGSSLGGHFNPSNVMHAGPEDKERHVGDLGNIEADKSGRAKYNRLDQKISLHGRNSIIGRSIVIKEKADDYKTRPGGGAGMRIACGVIGISSLEAD
ncbi:MAG: superoxide dismutase family protein [Spirochaetaceae bacterium]|nr:MAG: superoxide dismutase family protein [Spirochaetaceae bacterium]